ncbi:MAG: hypothetical protein DME17_11745 [Candidatus Rokuibacteriota bacterium]|nr:MAG: hypothetical protein DME17_11745 [Candidatus Rokubacteria bacterium]
MVYTPPMTIAASALTQQWEVQGFAAPLAVLSEDEVRHYREEFDRLEAREGRDRAEIKLIDRHFDLEFVWRLAHHPRVLDAVEAAIGPNILLLASHFFCKYPAVGAEGRGERFVAWHQDVTYWGLEPPLAVSGWIAIDDSDVENGCLRVVRGSHRNGLLSHGRAEREGNLLSVNQAIPPELVDLGKAVDVCLRAGQMSLHHGLLVHGSNPNRSSRRRCGLSIRYIPPDVRQVTPNSLGSFWRAVLVRGENRSRHFPPPALPPRA